MKNIAFALTIFALIACGKKDENKSGGSTTTALTGTNFNSLDTKTGLCVLKTLSGVIHFSRGYIFIGGRQYTATNPQIVDQAINYALERKVITYKQTTDVRFNAKITARATPGMMNQYPNQGYVDPMNNQLQQQQQLQQCNSSTLELEKVVITKQL